MSEGAFDVSAIFRNAIVVYVVVSKPGVQLLPQYY
jgi:hypothetical protein